MGWRVKMEAIHSIHYGCEKRTGGKEVCYDKGHAGIKGQIKFESEMESFLVDLM